MIDGPLLVREALESEVPLETVFFEGSFFDRADEGVLISELELAGVHVQEVAPESLGRVLDVAAPQGIAAIARQHTHDFGEICEKASLAKRPLLVAAGVADPGNAGTLIRVAEAADCAGVAFTRGSVDLFNPKVVRGSAGAVFRVPTAREVSDQAVVDHCAESEIALVATVARGGIPPEAADLRGTCAFVIGSESHGIPNVVESAASIGVTIPMAGEIESLNAGISAALLAFEAARQRRRRAESEL